MAGLNPHARQWEPVGPEQQLAGLTLSPSVSEKIETATMMAHSIGTQALYQRDDEASDSE